MEKGEELADSLYRSMRLIVHRFVEFENAGDLKTAVEKLDQREFKGATVSCVADVSQNFPLVDAGLRGPSYQALQSLSSTSAPLALQSAGNASI